MKPRYIVFSDLHIADYKRYSDKGSRLKIIPYIADQVFNAAKMYDVPVLFCGDLFDNPKEITNEEFAMAITIFNLARRWQVKIFAIDGNHDQSEKNTSTNRSVNWVTSFSNIYPNIISVCDNTQTVHRGVRIIGIPYMTDKKEWFEELKGASSEAKRMDTILMIHTSLPGLREPNGLELIVDYLEPLALKKFFKPFKIILNGHIHKPQLAYDNLITVGATHQQRLLDKGTEMGYWIIYEGYGHKFIPLDTPQFKEYPEGEGHEDTHDYWVPVPKEVKDKTKTGIIFKPTNTATQLAQKYMDSKGIKSTKKQNLIAKYIDNART